MEGSTIETLLQEYSDLLCMDEVENEEIKSTRFVQILSLQSFIKILIDKGQYPSEDMLARLKMDDFLTSCKKDVLNKKHLQEIQQSNDKQNDLDNAIKKTRGRQSQPFVSYVNGDIEKRMDILHKVMNGRKGKGAALIIRVAVAAGWITRPTSKAVQMEFPGIGNKSGFNKYMDDRYKFSDDEMIGAKAQLGLM